ncbi:MAG: GIY-YIG nuclease family protein [Patescibacteria group bacterium]
MQQRLYYIYIMASPSGTLYIGVTNNIARRNFQHRFKLNNGFTRKYNCSKLIYWEEYHDIREAIAREKQLKKWSRKKKETLIKQKNPHWEDYGSLLINAR